MCLFGDDGEAGARGSVGEAVWGIERVVDVGVVEVSWEEREADDEEEVRMCCRRVEGWCWCWRCGSFGRCFGLFVGGGRDESAGFAFDKGGVEAAVGVGGAESCVADDVVFVVFEVEVAGVCEEAFGVAFALADST